MPSSILNIFSTLLVELADTQRSLHTVIDSALAVVLCGIVKSNSVSTQPPPPPPPPTRTIPWDVPGTKTIPGGGDYQGNSALPVIAFCMTLATCAVVLSLLSRFGVMRHLVKTVDACIYAVLIVLLAPIAILVRATSGFIQIVLVSQHAVAIQLRHIHTQIKKCIVHSKRLISGVVHSIKLGVRKSTSLVNIGSIYALALLVLPIALLLHLADVAFAIFEQHKEQGPDPPDPRADPPPLVETPDLQAHSTCSITHPVLDPPVLDPPSPLADVLPAPRLASLVEAQDVDPHSIRPTASYATAPGADSVRPSDKPAKSSMPPTGHHQDRSNVREPETTAS
ncbi:hypothetical protein FB45DRAFT_179689 [Roridomyces roridus]|uniref:Uncharacterized protein n=1 Tax=Roridomyces roridus TaxID=1738132 RepID=A0AAD7CE02_9AGAR|nr:hypothetical protein FB45DRAFT_179689 [Roridomyces roridus]